MNIYLLCTGSPSFIIRLWMTIYDWWWLWVHLWLHREAAKGWGFARDARCSESLQNGRTKEIHCSSRNAAFDKRSLSQRTIQNYHLSMTYAYVNIYIYVYLKIISTNILIKMYAYMKLNIVYEIYSNLEWLWVSSNYTKLYLTNSHYVSSLAEKNEWPRTKLLKLP